MNVLSDMVVKQDNDFGECFIHSLLFVKFEKYQFIQNYNQCQCLCTIYEGYPYISNAAILCNDLKKIKLI